MNLTSLPTTETTNSAPQNWQN